MGAAVYDNECPWCPWRVVVVTVHVGSCRNAEGEEDDDDDGEEARGCSRCALPARFGGAKALPREGVNDERVVTALAECDLFLPITDGGVF